MQANDQRAQRRFGGPLVGCLACLLLLNLWGAEAVLQCDHPSGFYDKQIEIVLTGSGDTPIYYSTNGALPRPSTAARYTRPISVNTTTILRAQAFDAGIPSGCAVNRTFLFAPDVIKQNGTGFPATWGTNDGQAVTAYYRIKLGAIPDGESFSSVAAGLKAIPSLSVIADQDDLFSAERGIYANPEMRGNHWERAASIELIDPAGQNGFGATCGIRIHGNTSRNPNQSPKHSLRIVFKKQYGDSTLRCALFDPRVTNEWTTLILRAGHNNSWLHPESAQRRRADYLRDEWMRRSMRELGYPSAQGRFVHLYLNGLYWGIYNLCEDPGSLPGKPAIEIRKGNELKSGDSKVWNKVFELANAGLADHKRYGEVEQFIDLGQFTDYLILNLYAGTSDWDRANNWYPIRSRETGAKYQFFVWDAERTLEDPNADLLDSEDKESPSALFHALIDNPDYRALFQAHAHRLLEGPLSPKSSANRYQKLANELQHAIPAEAARWGSYRFEINPFGSEPFEVYNVAKNWRPELDRILNNYFPQRTGIVVQQLTQSGLYH